METEKLDENRKDALRLTEALWSSIDWNRVPMRLVPRIYTIFADWVQESAYTGSLPQFMSNFADSAICNAVPGENTDKIAGIMSSGRDRQILQCLREETAALVIFLRARRDAPKEAKRKQFLAERTEEEKVQLQKFEDLQEKTRETRR